MRCKITLVSIIILTCTETMLGALEEKPIPDHLLSCYKVHPTVLPQTMETLIEIIRKIEMAPNFNMDMKMFSNALLHRFRVDGIEKDPNVNQNFQGVLPYKTSGFQSYRQQVLFQYLIPDSNVFLPFNILSEIEKCNLHWMLSSTVDIWERGDEMKSCPQSIQRFMSGPLQRFGAKMSSCPEEWGVVYQEHGTVSPGTVIAGIAAGLSPLAVQESLMLTFSEQIQPSRYPGWVIPPTSGETVNNTYVATLSGDLAEIVQFQINVNDVYFGPAGVWNDSYVPIASYFTNLDNNRIEKKIWQMTDAEILGGVDGLLLSNLILTWTSKLKDLRLSQVLDMYYSDKGVMSDSNLRSCNREINIDGFINQENQSLLNQVQNFANVLATKVPSYPTDSKINIPARSLQVVNKFTPYLSNLMRRSKCLPRIPHSEKINLNVIIDQTWPSFTTLQLMMFLSRAIDVNYYGSSMTIINGQKEKNDFFIVNNSLNTTAIFLKWTSSVIEPYTLNFPDSLLALKAKVEDSIEFQKTLRRYRSHSHITLVIGYSSTITDADHDKAKTTVSAIKSLNPDMKFVYVTSRTNSQRFVQLTGLAGSHNDKIVSIDSIGNIQSVISQLQDPLSLVPRSLIGPFCSQINSGAPESEYEEYVTPGQPLRYRIHPDYLCGSSVLQIKIINLDYGDIQVCMARDEVATGSALCKAIRNNEKYTFSISKPCIKPKKQIDQANSKLQWLETCKPVFLDVMSLKSLNKCSENECRYPDQVKFNIVLQGLQCVEPYKTICASASTFTSSAVTIASILIISVFKNFI